MNKNLYGDKSSSHRGFVGMKSTRQLGHGPVKSEPAPYEEVGRTSKIVFYISLLQKALAAEIRSQSASRAALRHHVKHTVLSILASKCSLKFASSTKPSQKTLLIVCIHISNYT